MLCLFFADSRAQCTEVTLWGRASLSPGCDKVNQLIREDVPQWGLCSWVPDETRVWGEPCSSACPLQASSLA